MHTPSCVLISTLLMIADGFTMHGPSGLVVVSLGTSVVLPCYVDKPLAMEGLEVEWRRTDSETLVHLYQDGESRPEAQDQDYQDRSHFFTDQIQHGNFSLRLDNLRAEDEGKYTCKVYSQQDSGDTEVQIKVDNVERLLVSGSSRSISASVGEDVTLNCSVDSHIKPEDIEEVSWRKTDEDILVLLYQNNESFPDSSDEQYRDRVEFFTDEIPKGNFSLRLKSVRTEDKGVYICQVFAGVLSANATVVLERLGFSSWHITVLVFCFVAGFGAVLLLCCLIYCRLKNTVNSRTIWNLQLSLVFCPNVCMFFAFILWGLNEGFLHETVTCCALFILRPVMLIWALSYLKYLKDNIKTWIRFFRITIEFTVFTVVVYSVLFTYGWRKRAHDTDFGCGLLPWIRGFGIANFVMTVLSNLLCCGIDLFWTHLTEITKWTFSLKFTLGGVHRTGVGCQCGGGGPGAQASLRVPPSLFFSFSLVLSCLLSLNFSVEILSLLCYPLRTSLDQWTLLMWSFGFPSPAFCFVALVQLLLLYIPVFCCLQAKLKFLDRRWIISLWMITIPLLDITLWIYILLTILEREREYLGWTCVFVFIEVLKMIMFYEKSVTVSELSEIQRRQQQTKTSQQGSNTLHLCNFIMYMFGAVGLVLLNSVTLAAELILKARNGERVLKDLRVIVFPSECVFALYWLILLIHANWKVVTTKFTHNRRNTHQRHRHQLWNSAETRGMENLSAPDSTVSQTQ